MGGKLRVLRVVVLAVVMLGGVVMAPPAAYADPEPSHCTANMSFTFPAPGITAVPAPIAAFGGTLVLNCLVLGDDAGLWTLPFTATATLESCLSGSGTGVWLAGGFAPDGAVIPGPGFSYNHVLGGLMAMNGFIPIGPELHTFVASMVWLPNLLPANCATVPTVGATATGLAHIPVD
ncbi:MAG: hypothetical protein QOI20_2129 [Acidimicrobiaceae bacterium]|jgi:hypothetical protein|nr:hypothetical protein [Acidimicrobiaceae bacterium]